MTRLHMRPPNRCRPCIVAFMIAIYQLRLATKHAHLGQMAYIAGQTGPMKTGNRSACPKNCPGRGIRDRLQWLSLIMGTGYDRLGSEATNEYRFPDLIAIEDQKSDAVVENAVLPELP